MALACAWSAWADTWIDPDTGITWTYTVSDGKASLGSGSYFGDRAVPTATTGAITIPSTLGGKPVTGIGDYAFESCGGLTSVTTPDSVTSIGDAAFHGCSALTSVTIPDSVTRIGDWAFEDCSELTSVTMGNGVTIIGGYAFSGCSVLTSVTIGNGVTNIEYNAFEGCSALTSVTIPDSVTRIGDYAFEGCNDALFDTTTMPGVKLVDGWAVGYTDALPSDLDLTGVRGIGDYSFFGCRELTSLTIPGSMTNIGRGAFYGCSGLSDSDGFVIVNNVIHYYCGSGGDITIPSSVTGIAFDGWDEFGLTSVNITDLAKWCSIDFEPIEHCCMSPTHTSPLFYAGELRLNGEPVWDLTIPDSVTRIGDYAFSRCSGLTSVTISEGVTSIGAGSFSDCSGLTSVTMKGDCPTVEESWFFGDAFYGVSSSCVVYLPQGNSTYSVSGGKWHGMTVEYYEPLTLTGVLDEPKLADVTTGGDAEWLPIDDATAKVGGSCAVSGALDESDEEMREIWLEAKVYGRGTLTFWWRVSCEPDPSGRYSCDFAAFEADDEVVVRKDGESDWVQVTKTFATDGEHVVRWTYNTDGRPSDDYDGCVWVDGVVWTPSGNPAIAPIIEGDEGATVTGDAETGFVVKPSEGKTAVEVTIPQGVDAAKVTVEVSPKVASVKPNGAKIKIVNAGADITEFLNVPAVDGNGVVDLAKSTVKEEIVKEAMDVEKGAKIELNAANPSLTTSNTRVGLFYTFSEGRTLGEMERSASKTGDGKPWSPEITVKGGNSAFYSIGVGKGE